LGIAHEKLRSRLVMVEMRGCPYCSLRAWSYFSIMRDKGLLRFGWDVQRSGGCSEVNSTGPTPSWLNMTDKLPAYVIPNRACVANLAQAIIGLLAGHSPLRHSADIEAAPKREVTVQQVCNQYRSHYDQALSQQRRKMAKSNEGIKPGHPKHESGKLTEIESNEAQRPTFLRLEHEVTMNDECARQTNGLAQQNNKEIMNSILQQNEQQGECQVSKDRVVRSGQQEPQFLR